MAAFDQRSLDVPIVQAGMGGVAWHELAAAVSEAGGLGTIGGVRAPIANEAAAARRPNVGRIEDIRPAAELVRALVP